jgi:hypothetical protein
VFQLKVKEFIKQLQDIGFDDNTEIIFNMDNDNQETCTDYYCQSVYAMMPFTYNAIGVDIDKKYK